MKKSIVWIVVVAVILAGGLYVLSAKTEKERMGEEETNAMMEKDLVAKEIPDNQATRKSFKIVSSESKAVYEINENLKGKPTHVTGNSAGLTGAIVVDTSGMNVVGGEVFLDANSFKTDIAMRDENVKKYVLKTSEANNDLVSFTIKSVTGGLGKDGKESDLKVSGDLTIIGVTKEVTFDAKGSWQTDGSIKAVASTTLAYGDFGVAIPNLSFLSNVDKTVKVSVAFVAR